jgi:hypothetical protein
MPLNIFNFLGRCFDAVDELFYWCAQQDSLRQAQGKLFLRLGNSLLKAVKFPNEMVRPAGFEPATYGFVVRYSIQLSYGRT